MTTRCDRGRGPRQDVREGTRARRHRHGGARGQRLRAARAERRRARPRRSGSCPRCCSPTPAGPSVGGFDVVRQPDGGPPADRPDRPVRGGRRAAVGPGEPLMIGRLLGFGHGGPLAPGRPSCSRTFDLSDAATKIAKTYSGGMRRRLDLAASLVGRPRVPVPRRADDRARPARAGSSCGA